MNEVKIAGWNKTARNDSTFISLKIEIDGKDYHANIFENNRKSNDKQPDWRTIDKRKETDSETIPL